MNDLEQWKLFWCTAIIVQAVIQCWNVRAFEEWRKIAEKW